MCGRVQRNKVMKYGEGPGEPVVHGPKRPRYATGQNFFLVFIALKCILLPEKGDSVKRYAIDKFWHINACFVH